jgi:hypothetical protein
MSPLFKILLVAAHAATVTLIPFLQPFPSVALAKPIERSLPPRTMAEHYIKEHSARAFRSKNSKPKALASHHLHPSPANVSYHPQAYSYPGSHLPAGSHVRSGDINVDTTAQNIDILNTYYTKAYDNAKTLSTQSTSLLCLCAEKIRLIQRRILLGHRLRSIRAHTNCNRTVLLRSQTSILTLKASRKRSVKWVLTKVTHTMTNTTLLKD